MKTCKDCGERKLVTEFFKNPRMKSGRYNTCKSCYNKMKAEYRDRDENGDRVTNDMMRAWR